MSFIKGLFAKEKHDNAPDFVICDVSLKREELIKSLQERSEDWINCQVKRSKEGKIYIEENTFKKKEAF